MMDQRSTLSGRMFRAAKLDSELFEEVEHDPTATGQAVMAVLISSVAAGIGSIAFGSQFFVLGVIGALFTWFVWAGLTYFIGTRLLPEPQTKASFGQLFRTVGFSSSPGVIRVVGIVPVLWIPVNLIALVWILAAMVVAVRQALDYTSTVRAVAVVGLGWIIQVALTLAL